MIQKEKAEEFAPTKVQDWFKRHLNITLLLSQGGALILVYSPPVLFYDTKEMLFFLWAGIIAGIALGLGVEIWYLKQKGRSLGFLLLNIMNGIGLIILLCLENRREVKREKEEV